MVSWDWKTDEFGGYETGFTTFIIKSFENLGFISGMKTASSKSIREALYNAALNKKLTIDEVFENVKKSAEYETAKQKLRYVH